MKKFQEIVVIQDKYYKKLKEEVDELTIVWSQEEEKMSQMQKLVSALFEEVTDTQKHAKDMD